MRGVLRIERVAHPSLAGNWLGDPVERIIPVYLPPNYDPARRYPVVYWLAGYSGTALSRTNVSGFEPNLFERFDRLIDRGAIPPALLVAADGFTRYGGSQYLDSPTTGRYQDAIAVDLVSWVDRQFATVATREGRAIAGHSSGGYGALLMGMQRPETFGLVISHSGDAYFEFCYLPDIAKHQHVIARQGGPAQFVEWFWAQDPVRSDAVAGLNLIAMAAAYSPNPSAPAGVDLPWDEETGTLREDVWLRWLRHDPVRLVHRHADALRSLSLLYLDCGNRDEYNLHYGARLLARRLREAGVPHVHEEYDGGHSGVTYRIERSLQYVADVWRSLQPKREP
ncbi:MAG: esterase [Dehalococcoidia bacterium]|nr:MAG: esterase [Dehalococcoidia bacterium]